MSFHPFMEQYVKRVAAKSVCELGNQTWQGKSAASYYRTIGITDYACLDCNSKHGAILVDLNEPVDIKRQFDLVTNNGTGEHIFDQAMVLRNMHTLCRPGGHMIHVMPFHNWHNHGFYSFHPVLYRDLAAANGYTVVDMCIANRWGEASKLEPADYERAKPTKDRSGKWMRGQSLINKVNELIRKGEPTVMVACILRKAEKESEFKKPMQDIYDGDNNDHARRG